MNNTPNDVKGKLLQAEANLERLKRLPMSAFSSVVGPRGEVLRHPVDIRQSQIETAVADVAYYKKLSEGFEPTNKKKRR